MKAVHFGAGNIGRGFIGELLYESGFSTTFVDVVKATVDYINETNSYEMYIIDNNEKKVIKNVKAFSPITNEADIVEAICEADLITTSVCVDNLDKIAPTLAKGLKERLNRGIGKVDVMRQIINLTQTTSGSYLLMSSLDISRRNLALRGRQVFHQVADMAEYAREEINAVGGYYAFGKELCNGNSVFDFDTTKLSVHTLDIGLAGIEVYDILRDEYDIQIEFGDIGNILAYLSIGDRPQEVERLVSALAEIKRRYRTDGSGLLSQEYIDPVVAASPQEAFYAPKKSLPLRETEGMVCSEFVMCYPPGIPILAPGERITKEILNYIEYAKAKGCSMTGPEDPDILHLNVLA